MIPNLKQVLARCQIRNAIILFTFCMMMMMMIYKLLFVYMLQLPVSFLFSSLLFMYGETDSMASEFDYFIQLFTFSLFCSVLGMYSIGFTLTVQAYLMLQLFSSVCLMSFICFSQYVLRQNICCRQPMLLLLWVTIYSIVSSWEEVLTYMNFVCNL